VRRVKGGERGAWQKGVGKEATREEEERSASLEGRKCVFLKARRSPRLFASMLFFPAFFSLSNTFFLGLILLIYCIN
jgi:hypothetical protein